jgi:hypothetical protein
VRPNPLPRVCVGKYQHLNPESLRGMAWLDYEHTVRYTELSPTRFKDFWLFAKPNVVHVWEWI